MRGRKSNAEFSMSQLGADFSHDIANFAPYSPDNVVPGGRAMGGKNYVQGAAKQVENAAGGIGNTIKKAADSVGKQAVAAKNKVAVLVKGADGKVFVQQRWKNVKDAGKAVGNAAKQAGGVIKANPGKAAAAGILLAGTALVANDLYQNNRTPSQIRRNQAMAKAFNGGKG